MRLKHKTYFWEQRKLGEIVEIVGGGTPDTAIPEYWNGSIDWYSPTEIGNQIYVQSSTKKITSLGLQKSSAKLLPPHRTILFTSRAGIGDMAILANQGSTNQGFQSFVVDNNIDVYFLYSLGYKIKEYALKNASGSTFLEISKNTLSKMGLFIPSLEEQTAIGNFFKQLDDTIALHRRNCIKFQNLKVAYLESIFSAKYIQNKDKNKNAWEQRKLGEIVEIVMGQSPNSGNYTNNPKDHILVQGNADIKNGKVFPRIWTTQITKIGKKNDLIMSVRAPVGDMAKTDYDVVLGRGVCAIKGNEFIYQILSKMKIDGYWNALSTGSTFDAINSNDIKKTLISIPKEQEEQTAIGNFFKQLDDTIALHQRFWVNNNQFGREYAELF
ncbi:restriction endonuclease subunit S [Actinobacillus porcinus]|uniref:restriction endonuclease subunit S n=2 Tax=Actinobacillus porcinus TaxID=51048 RepID=UPI002A911EC2|nr:restriction endonuclease subunit S [Actinobacillus porcinus]MDY5421791.1 restriction endonuclease subunit S [Actinobacillus porcinus]